MSGGAPTPGRRSFEERCADIARGWYDLIGTGPSAAPTLNVAAVDEILAAMEAKGSLENFDYIISRWSALLTEGAGAEEKIEFGANDFTPWEWHHGLKTWQRRYQPGGDRAEQALASWVNAADPPRLRQGRKPRRPLPMVRSPLVRAALKRLINQLSREMLSAPIEQASETKPRADVQRYGAMLLAVIFGEYTGGRPTRPTWDVENEVERVSPFYRFARVCFRFVFTEPHEIALREACEWFASACSGDGRAADEKRALSRLLFGRRASVQR